MAVAKTIPRPLRSKVADWAITRLLKLPLPTSEYTISRDAEIPMRDGVILLADIYTPVTAVAGTILVRSPYGYLLPMAALLGGVYASRGYRVILARCRGTFGSGGLFEPMVHEIADAADTVAWMREQPWFRGRFATFGGSYMGFAQWALLMDPPPELATAVISIAPHDFYAAVFHGGAFNLEDFLRWSDQVAHQEDLLTTRIAKFITAGYRVSTAAHKLPLVSAGEELLKGRSPWYRDWVSRRDPRAPMWSPMRGGEALDRVNIPVLLQSGWQDTFLQQTLEQYAHLRSRGLDVGLTMGPWTHGNFVIRAGALVGRETLDWFNRYLAGSSNYTRANPVRLFVTGFSGVVGEWREMQTWPPRTSDLLLYPVSEDKLGDRPAPPGLRGTFTYSPADPTPTNGGRILFGGGYVDDSALARRQDVLVFTGAILSKPLEVHGNPVVELAHSTDNPHADLFVRLTEVDRTGKSRNVSDGFLRLDPAAANGVIQLNMDAIAHRFAAGNRLRLIIAGGCHPRWERNLGTGENPATAIRMVASHRTIDLARSCLRLPVIQ